MCVFFTEGARYERERAHPPAVPAIVAAGGGGRGRGRGGGRGRRGRGRGARRRGRANAPAAVAAANQFEEAIALAHAQAAVRDAAVRQNPLAVRFSSFVRTRDYVRFPFFKLILHTTISVAAKDTSIGCSMSS